MSCSIERYPDAFYFSQKVLNLCGCASYPVDIERIITSYAKARIIVISETDYKRFRFETKQTRPYIAIKDGRVYYSPKRDIYTIVYNETSYKNRIRFTLAHEFAHIVLGHLSDQRTEINRGGLPDVDYYAYEGAANTFAGNFLVPPIILSEKLGGTPFISSVVARLFQISTKSVEDFRKADFAYWTTLTPTQDEFHILSRYRMRRITYFCDDCSSVFMIRGAKYCPICGAKAKIIKPGVDESVGRIYEKIELNEKGQVKECAVCGNEEHVNEALYCMICGKPIVNRCVSAINEIYDDQLTCQHTEPLPGNARYCPYCGGRTTFLVENVLREWEKVIASSSGSDFAGEYDDDGELPF